MKNTHKYANPLEYDAGTLESIMIERDYTLSRTICTTFEVTRIREICYIFDNSHIGLS